MVSCTYTTGVMLTAPALFDRPVTIDLAGVSGKVNIINTFLEFFGRWFYNYSSSSIIYWVLKGGPARIFIYWQTKYEN